MFFFLFFVFFIVRPKYVTMIVIYGISWKQMLLKFKKDQIGILVGELMHIIKLVILQDTGINNEKN